MSNYEGKTWQTTSHQWSWVVLFKGDILVSGSGYPSEESAQVDLDERLADYQWTSGIIDREMIDRADSAREFQEGPDFEGVSYD